LRFSPAWLVLLRLGLPLHQRVEKALVQMLALAACLLAALLFFLRLGIRLFDSGSGGERGASRADFMGLARTDRGWPAFYSGNNLPASRPQPDAENTRFLN